MTLFFVDSSSSVSAFSCCILFVNKKSHLFQCLFKENLVLELKRSLFFLGEEGREQLILEEEAWAHLLQSCDQLKVLSAEGLLLP